MAWAKRASAVVGIFTSLSLSLCIVALRQWWRRRDEAAAAERKVGGNASNAAEERKAALAHVAETTPSEVQSEAHVVPGQPYIDDPRPGRTGRCRVRAFSFPGHEEACDKLCQVPFLGLQFEVPGGLRLQAPPLASSSSSSYHNQELVFRDSAVALQALKFWEHAKEFEHLTGLEALKEESNLCRRADLTYAGFGSSWEAMRAILKAKFVAGSEMAARLRLTGDDFLLEHRSEETAWCNNGEALAPNWLGFQLMLLRDVLAERSTEPGSWTRSFFDEKAGLQISSMQEAWKAAVRSANEALSPLLSLVCATDGTKQVVCSEVAKRGLKHLVGETEEEKRIAAEEVPGAQNTRRSIHTPDLDRTQAPSTGWAGAAAVARLAHSALDEAASHFDNDTSRWIASGTEDNVWLSSLSLPGTRLPMFRGLLEIPTAQAPYLDDVAQVMLSYAGRRFWDQMFESSVVLARCSADATLQCEFRKPSPVNGRSLGVGALGVRRNTPRGDSAGFKERVTVALTAIPENLVAPFSSRIQELSGGTAVRADAKLQAVDALVREDGSMRVGFLLHTELSTVKLPAFLLRKILASVPAVPVRQIVMMASTGMTPRHTVALAGPEPEETEERTIDGRCIRVSTMLRSIFPASTGVAGSM